jgi:dimethylargininase
MVQGLTSASLGKPDYSKALEQHDAYIHALQLCGLTVSVLDAEEDYPDSTFIEDAALLTHRCAIITRPGAESRRGEIASIEPVISQFYKTIAHIREPGTVEAGDVMMVGDHFYIGISQRTNMSGAEQLISLLEEYGLTGSTVKLSHILHLKTGVAFLEENTLAATGELFSFPVFRHFRLLAIPEEESYACNCVWINGYVLLADGFPQTRKIIERAGYQTIIVDVSEFRKLDGGLSCLSLRF